MNKKGFGILVAIGGIALSVLAYYFDPLKNEPISLAVVQYVAVLFGFGVFQIGLRLISAPLSRSFIKYLCVGLFISGGILLGLNIYGEFTSLRNPAIYNGFEYRGRLRIPKYKPEEVYPLLDKQIQETNEEYAYRLTQLVYDATVHYWDQSSDYSEYNHRVPIYENFLLWQEHPKNYEFCNAEIAIERGVSICSQATRIIVQTWKKNGLSGNEVALDGHVVAEVFIGMNSQNNRIKWVLDSDLGVVFEHPISFLEEHPEVVQATYTKAGYPVNVGEKMALIYENKGNYKITTNGYCDYEKYSYILKWRIPLLLTTPFLLLTLLEIRKERIMGHKLG